MPESAQARCRPRRCWFGSRLRRTATLSCPGLPGCRASERPRKPGRCKGQPWRPPDWPVRRSTRPDPRSASSGWASCGRRPRRLALKCAPGQKGSPSERERLADGKVGARLLRGGPPRRCRELGRRCPSRNTRPRSRSRSAGMGLWRSVQPCGPTNSGPNGLMPAACWRCSLCAPGWPSKRRPDIAGGHRQRWSARRSRTSRWARRSGRPPEWRQVRPPAPRKLCRRGFRSSRKVCFLLLHLFPWSCPISCRVAPGELPW